MGYRVWNNYMEDAEAAWRALPWRERYNWRRIGWTLAFLIYIVAAVWLGETLRAAGLIPRL